jgi:hypothetical protein
MNCFADIFRTAFIPIASNVLDNVARQESDIVCYNIFDWLN